MRLLIVLVQSLKLNKPEQVAPLDTRANTNDGRPTSPLSESGQYPATGAAGGGDGAAVSEIGAVFVATTVSDEKGGDSGFPIWSVPCNNLRLRASGQLHSQDVELVDSGRSSIMSVTRACEPIVRAGIAKEVLTNDVITNDD